MDAWNGYEWFGSCIGSIDWSHLDYREIVYGCSGVLEEGSRPVGDPVSDAQREEIHSLGRQH